MMNGRLSIADDNVVVNYEYPFSEFDHRAGEDSYIHYCRCGGVFEVCSSSLFQ